MIYVNLHFISGSVQANSERTVDEAKGKLKQLHVSLQSELNKLSSTITHFNAINNDFNKQLESLSLELDELTLQDKTCEQLTTIAQQLTSHQQRLESLNLVQAPDEATCAVRCATATDQAKLCLIPGMMDGSTFEKFVQTSIDSLKELDNPFLLKTEAEDEEEAPRSRKKFKKLSLSRRKSKKEKKLAGNSSPNVLGAVTATEMLSLLSPKTTSTTAKSPANSYQPSYNSYRPAYQPRPVYRPPPIPHPPPSYRPPPRRAPPPRLPPRLPPYRGSRGPYYG